MQSRPARRPEKLVVLAAVLMGTLSVQALADSALVTNSANGHTYKRFDAPSTLQQARTGCAARGAHLVTLTTQQENDFVVTQFVQDSVQAWLGATDELVEGNWRWMTGEPWSFENWNAGEPNDGVSYTSGEDYAAVLAVNAGRWNDAGGPGLGATQNLLSYICEWERLYESVATYPVGNYPFDLTFANGYMYVVNANDATITKLSTKTGATTATFAAGGHPVRILFDGTYLWTANSAEGTVNKLSTSGTLLGSYYVGATPSHLAYDGSSVWVTQRDSGTATKIKRSTGAILGTYAVGSTPAGIWFDGTYIWAVSGPYQGAGSLVKLSKTGVTLATFNTGGITSGDIVSDGTYLYVTNYHSGTISKIRRADGELVNTLNSGAGVGNLLYEAHQLWAGNCEANTVTRFNTRDDALIETIPFPTGTGPCAIGFDGVRVWSSNQDGNSVSAF